MGSGAEEFRNRVDLFSFCYWATGLSLWGSGLPFWANVKRWVLSALKLDSVLRINMYYMYSIIHPLNCLVADQRSEILHITVRIYRVKVVQYQMFQLDVAMHMN